MGAHPFDIAYDQEADVLYITTADNAPAIAQEDEIGMVWRYSVHDGHIVGLTLIEFDGYWVERQGHIVEEMVARFHIPAATAQAALESVSR